MRGNRQPSDAHWYVNGSIPACAGEPIPTLGICISIQVYPRVCGGTPRRPDGHSTARGLSPRVRGNHARETVGVPLKRSIPACAGEPEQPTPPVVLTKVYPRVCGGTRPTIFGCRRRRGLSPRVRGNPNAPARSRADNGSIPACAGEPPAGRPLSIRHTVYPRVCGGTVSTMTITSSVLGLSPRVRGNPSVMA